MSSFIDLLKGRTQKYIKRIPKAGGGYRYVYKEHHKGGVGAQEHMKEGAAFKLTFGGQEGHFHIVKAQGDKITVKHDELHGPDHKGVEMTKAELSELLTREHKPALAADAKKKRERVERMKRETPRHIGLKRAERLAKEAEARLGEERKPQRFEGYGTDELGQSDYEKHGGLLDQAAERAGVPVSRNNVGRSADGRIVRDNTPQVTIDSAAGIRKIFKDITHTQAQFIQNRAIEWLAANSGDSPAEIREHIEHLAEINQANAAQKYKDAAAALSEVVGSTEDNRGRVDKQQGTIKALELIAEARKIGKQPTPAPTPTPDNFETMPEGERIANKAREAIERVKAHINELRDQQSMGLSEDEALEIDERILDAQLTLRKLEREEIKARRAAAKEQAPKAQPIEPPKPEPVKVEPAPAPKPVKVAPAPEPVYAHAQNTRRIVDRALSSKPTGVDLNDVRAVLPNIGDLKLMLSEKERLKRAKMELVEEFNRPNFLGQLNPERDIDLALDHYLNGPYVEIEQKRLRDIEKGFKIALRDARGEELEQVKEEIQRFWREWGGAYVRLHGELVTERTQGEALRKIRPLIQEGSLTPKINQMLDRLEDIIDQKPVTSNDPARWIFFQETNKATRDNPRQTFREHLAETAPEATTPTQEEAPKTPREQLIETAREATAPAPEPAPAQEEAPEMVAFVEQALRDSIGKMRPARIIQRGEKITNPATYDNIETRYFFAVASAKLGRQFVDLGSRLDTPETRQAITDIYRATHTKGANAEQAKAQAYPLILEQIINTLEGFDLKAWFQTDPESLAKIERRIETLKQLKAKAQTPREATAPAPEPVQEQQPAPDNFETMPKDEFLEHPQVKGIIGGERGEVFRALNAAPREITVRLNQIVLDNYKEHKTTGFPEDTTVAILQAYKHPEEMAAKDKKLKERQAALAGLDERLPLAGIKASDLSLADAQASYRGVSWSGKERGEQELLEFKDILDRLEETGRQYIEAGAHEGDVSSVISYHAQKILDAKRAQIAARGRTMSAMITGRGNFPVRSQKKKMDTYDKRLSEFVAAVDKAKKQLKKLDPNSRHAQRIEQGSGVDAYQAKLDKLIALQTEYKKIRAKARKEGKEPDLVLPRYHLTNNNNQIRRVREQIENEKQREQQLDTADKLKDYTMPDGNELQVDRDQKDNRLKLHFWEKPDSDTIAKLKRSGYKWSRYNEAWQRQLTTNALKELPSLLNNLGAVEAIEEADA